jgi:hypothetical protein
MAAFVPVDRRNWRLVEDVNHIARERADSARLRYRVKFEQPTEASVRQRLRAIRACATSDEAGRVRLLLLGISSIHLLNQIFRALLVIFRGAQFPRRSERMLN